ncbi:MAG: hypothetical protein ABSG36_03650 [Acidimicrobiales bacterium]
MLVLGSTLGSETWRGSSTWRCSLPALWARSRSSRKAGYSGWFVLLGLVLIVNIVTFFVFAFSE